MKQMKSGNFIYIYIFAKDTIKKIMRHDPELEKIISVNISKKNKDLL